jgi:hypothetical protein
LLLSSGMYDHIVAGGQPYGITPLDNVIKECEEEASIPIELAKLAKCTGKGLLLKSEWN